MQYQYSWLRSFHYTATFGTITEAAKYLDLSNSTLSHQIKDLESFFKVKLFYRSSNKILLTHIGISLKKITDQYFQKEKEIKKFLIKVKHRVNQVLNLGATNPTKLMPIVERLNSQEEKINFNLFFEKNRILYDMFIKNKIDLLVMSDDYFKNKSSKLDQIDHLNIDSIPFYHDQLVFISHQDYQLSSPNWEEMLQHKILLPEKSSIARKRFDYLCSKTELYPLKTIEISSREGIVAAINEKLGVGIGLHHEMLLYQKVKTTTPLHDLIEQKDLEIKKNIYYHHNISNVFLIKKIVSIIQSSRYQEAKV